MAAIIVPFLLVLLFFHRANAEAKNVRDKVESQQDDKGKSHRITMTTVSHGIGEVGRAIHEVTVGEFDEITDASGNKKARFVTKKLPFVQKLPKLAGYFGVIGTIFSIITSFLPATDSPELKEMKKSFSEVNRKLDGITNSLQETKHLVKEYSQKAVNLKAEHNIISAYKQLESCTSKLMKVSCLDEDDCKLKKMEIATDYKDSLDVRRDVDMILRGATRDSVFGTSLVQLISESSQCNINKITSFQSAIAVLVTKGSSAAAFHSLISKRNFNMTADVRFFQSLMFDLEKQKDIIITKCYRDINKYIISDAYDQRLQSAESSIKEQNKKILDFLSMKYPWIPFYIVTCKMKSDTNPVYWTNEKIQNDINAKTKDSKSKTKSFVFIGSNNRVENEMKKKKIFTRLLSDKEIYDKPIIGTDISFEAADKHILKMTRYDTLLREQFRSILVVSDYEDLIIGYLDNSKSLKQIDPKNRHQISRDDIIAYYQCDYLEHSCKLPTQIITTISTKDVDIDTCSRDCSSHGKCFFLPHSKTMGCECDADHYGESCTNSASDATMALDLAELVDISFKLPSLVDLSIQLKDAKVALRADVSNIQKAIKTLDKKLTNIFRALSRELMTSFDWHGLITQYGQIVRDLKYYYHILIEKDTTDCKNPAFPYSITTTCKGQKIAVTKEKQELARLILKPDKLRRQLHQLNYLFIGRQDISLISHKPLLFQTMEKYRNSICTSEYKHTLDKVYKQLLLLQFQGYIVWLHALKLIDMDTNFVVNRYKGRIQQQSEFFASKTCQINIKNSVKFEKCINGYYLYSGMKEEVECKETFHITTLPSRLFVQRVIKASSELSTTRSSAKQIIGPPDVFPSYGAHMKAWSPSRHEINNKQFIEVAFKDPLYIQEILIYETYHGGAAWKIEGFYKNTEWKILWKTEKSNLQDIQSSRIFNVPIQVDWSTSQLKIHIDCMKSNKAVQIDAIAIKGKPVEGTCSWYDSFSCLPCNCDTIGSIKKTCSSDGQCSCKPGYKGKKCNKKDCAMGQWSAWTRCHCGPGKTKTRNRRVVQARYGEGKPCGKVTDVQECNIACVCGEGEWGDFCEHKNCLVSDWGNWETCPHQERYLCGLKPPDRKYVARRRKVTRWNANHGRGCPSLKESKSCALPQCYTLNFGTMFHG